MSNDKTTINLTYISQSKNSILQVHLMTQFIEQTKYNAQNKNVTI